MRHISACTDKKLVYVKQKIEERQDKDAGVDKQKIHTQCKKLWWASKCTTNYKVHLRCFNFSKKINKHTNNNNK